jgi:hypothetical protein
MNKEFSFRVTFANPSVQNDDDNSISREWYCCDDTKVWFEVLLLNQLQFWLEVYYSYCKKPLATSSHRRTKG